MTSLFALRYRVSEPEYSIQLLSGASLLTSSSGKRKFASVWVRKSES